MIINEQEHEKVTVHACSSYVEDVVDFHKNGEMLFKLI